VVYLDDDENDTKVEVLKMVAKKEKETLSALARQEVEAKCLEKKLRATIFVFRHHPHRNLVSSHWLSYRVE